MCTYSLFQTGFVRNVCVAELYELASVMASGPLLYDDLWM